MQGKPPYTQFVSAEIFPKQAVASSIHSVSAVPMFSYSPLLDNYLYNAGNGSQYQSQREQAFVGVRGINLTPRSINRRIQHSFRLVFYMLGWLTQ